MDAENTAVKQVYGVFCKKNTTTGRILLHCMVNYIRGRLEWIGSIEIYKSAIIKNGRQKYTHQASWAFYLLEQRQNLRNYRCW